MALNPEALYMHLGRLVQTMPNLAIAAITPDIQQWLGRAGALIEQIGKFSDIAEMRAATSGLAQPSLKIGSAHTIKTLIYRALATAEFAAPATAQGAFIPAGNEVDAFAAIAKVLDSAKAEVLIVDPYLDEKALTDFGPLAPEGVSLRLLADGYYHYPTLLAAARRWPSQYASRPLELRLSSPRVLHDRLIVIDGKDVWSITQSLKDFAVRSPASIVRVDDPEIAGLKIAAYEERWLLASTFPI
jgi:hypothetical protein